MDTNTQCKHTDPNHRQNGNLCIKTTPKAKNGEKYMKRQGNSKNYSMNYTDAKQNNRQQFKDYKSRFHHHLR